MGGAICKRAVPGDIAAGVGGGYVPNHIQKNPHHHQHQKYIQPPPPSFDGRNDVCEEYTELRSGDKMRERIVRMFNSKIDPTQMGVGRDAHGKSVKSVRIMAVYDVARQRDPFLMQDFDAFVSRQAKKGLRSTTIREMHEGRNMDHIIDSDSNTLWLFHGTSSEALGPICKRGFEARIASDGGMFGRGIYFAMDPTKSDQYCKENSASGLCYIIVASVCMGTRVYRTDRGLNGISRPPCVSCKDIASKCEHERFHSVWSDIARHRYHEYIVYENRQCVPRYVICYQRK